MFARFLYPLAALALIAGPAAAQRQPPVVGVGAGMKSYAEIKAATTARIGGRLIGDDFDPQTFTYQLRYMRGNEIIDVVVDARTGRILDRRESM